MCVNLLVPCPLCAGLTKSLILITSDHTDTHLLKTDLRSFPCVAVRFPVTHREVIGCAASLYQILLNILGWGLSRRLGTFIQVVG